MSQLQFALFVVKLGKIQVIKDKPTVKEVQLTCAVTQFVAVMSAHRLPISTVKHNN